MRHVLCTFKILPKDCQRPVPVLTLCGDWLEIFSSFRYLEGLATTDGGIKKKVEARTTKAWTAFWKLRHLLHRHDIRFSLSVRVCGAIIRSVLSELAYPRWGFPGAFFFRPSVSPKHWSTLVGTSVEQWQDVSSFVGCRRSSSTWENHSITHFLFSSICLLLRRHHICFQAGLKYKRVYMNIQAWIMPCCFKDLALYCVAT